MVEDVDLRKKAAILIENVMQKCSLPRYISPYYQKGRVYGK